MTLTQYKYLFEGVLASMKRMEVKEMILVIEVDKFDTEKVFPEFGRMLQDPSDESPTYKLITKERALMLGFISWVKDGCTIHIKIK